MPSSQLTRLLVEEAGGVDQVPVAVPEDPEAVLRDEQVGPADLSHAVLQVAKEA